MPNRTNPQSICSHDGVFFARVKARADGYCEDAGNGDLAEVIEETIQLSDKTAALAGLDLEKAPVKVVFKKVCVEVHRFEHCYVAVCYELGSQVVKSMKRMIRRVARSYNRADFRGPEQPVVVGASDRSFSFTVNGQSTTVESRIADTDA